MLPPLMARVPARGRRGGLGWLGSLVLSVVLGTLLFVTTLEIRSGRNPVVPAGPSVDCSGRLDQLSAQVAEVTAALEASGLALPAPTEESQGAGPMRWVHRQYDVELPPALTLEAITQRLDPLTERDPCVSVQALPADAGARVQIGIDGLLTHTLAIRWGVPPTPVPPRIALIIADLGGDLLVARELTEIDAPITFAVAPFRPFSKEVAERASLQDREVLLQLPIEADGGDRFGDSPVLTANASEADVQQVLGQALTSVPHAVGVSNTAGARFARDRKRMGWIMAWLGPRQLCFIDGVTTGDGVVAATAAAAHVATAGRDVALDNVQDDAAVREQLAALLQRAKDHGAAIGIGHPYAVTIAALRDVIPTWRDAGVDLVRLSVLVRVPNLPAPTLAPH